MSGATYRIELEHTPGEVFKWYATVYDLADDSFPVHTCHRETDSAAVKACRAWVVEQTAKHPTRTFYVDDFGQDAEAHSVKA